MFRFFHRDKPIAYIEFTLQDLFRLQNSDAPTRVFNKVLH
jgi:hypothetical protein